MTPLFSSAAEPVDDLVADGGRAGDERRDAEEHRGAHDVARQRLAGGAAKIRDQIELHLLHLVGREVDFHVAADARVDAVDPLAALEEFEQACASFGDAGAGAAGSPHFFASARDAHDLFDGERVRSEYDHVLTLS